MLSTIETDFLEWLADPKAYRERKKFEAWYARHFGSSIRATYPDVIAEDGIYDKVIGFFTSNGAHIPLHEGESKRRAVQHLNAKDRLEKALPLVKDAQHRSRLLKVFEDVPESALKLLEQHCGNVRVKNIEKDTEDQNSHFQPDENTIYLNSVQDESDEKLLGLKGFADNVVRHEFGHAIDENMGKRGLFGRKPFSESDPDFVKAVKDLCNIDNDTLLKKANAYFGDGKKQNLWIADMFSAAVSGAFWIEVKTPNHSVMAGHDPDYWNAKPALRNNELFANIFSLYTQPDPQDYRDAKLLFPALIHAFEKALSGKEK